MEDMERENGKRKMKRKMKSKIFCVMLLMVAAAGFFAVGKWQRNVYDQLIKNCTSVLKGRVVYDKGVGRREDPFAAENKYVVGKYWKQIEVETDGTFRHKNIYATRYVGHKGDESLIYYDPNDPDDYYVNNGVEYYKDTAVAAYAGCGIMLVLACVLAVVVCVQYKLQKHEKGKRIYFDTPYGRFFFDEVQAGYECDVEWPLNLNGEAVTAFFETDQDAMPELNPIKPAECYERLAGILADKERTDYEIKRLMATYFLFKPEFVREGATEQDLKDGLALTFISALRNGDLEFGLYSSNVYADELRLIYRRDGKKELSYRSEDQEVRDEL